jgi:hypothetical protein
MPPGIEGRSFEFPLTVPHLAQFYPPPVDIVYFGDIMEVSDKFSDRVLHQTKAEKLFQKSELIVASFYRHSE